MHLRQTKLMESIRKTQFIGRDFRRARDLMNLNIFLQSDTRFCKHFAKKSLNQQGKHMKKMNMKIGEIY